MRESKHNLLVEIISFDAEFEEELRL